MRDPHVPEDAFVERLEWRLGAEVRRRNRLAEAPRWLPASPLWRVVTIAAVIVTSMAAGGAVVAAAYQAQVNELRDLLVPSYEGRVSAARAQVDEAARVLGALQRQVSIGMATEQDLVESRAKLSAARAELDAAKLLLEEVRATGQQPITDVAAPLVSGRDFVSEVWRAEMSSPAAALDAAKTQLSWAQRQFSVGTATQVEIDAARTRIIELQAALTGFQRKLEVRHVFLNHERDAAAANLLVRQIEAEQKRTAIEARIDLARRNLAAIQVKVNVGLAEALDAARASLDLQQLEVEMAKANLDLEVVRRQLAERGIK